MAGIPLFTPDYLSSPTMFGAISPTTARIMSETGKEIKDSIEKNNAHLEAQAKAPQIASLMGEGLKRLSGGDMSGFQVISQAQALGSSNPFLLKMTQDALATGSRMATNYMDNEMAQSRQDSLLKRQESREDSLLQRQNTANEAILFRQREDDWRRDVASIQSDYAKQVDTYNKDLDAYNKKRQEFGDTDATPPRKPQPPTLPPRPTQPQPAGEAPLPTGGAAPLPGGVSAPTQPGTRRLPFNKQAEPIQAEESGLFNTLNVDEVPVIADQQPPPPDAASESQATGVDALPTKSASPILANTTAPAVGEPGAVGAKQDPALTENIKMELGKEQPLVNEKPAAQPAVQSEKAQIGDMVFEFTPTDQGIDKTVTVNDSTGSVRYKKPASKTTEAWTQLKTSASKLSNESAGFAQWAARVTKAKDKIDFGTPKDGIYYPQTVNGKRYGYDSTREEDGKQITSFVPVGVTKETKEAWSSGQQAFDTLKDKGIKVDFAKPKYSEDQLTKQREAVLATLKEDVTKAKTPEEKGMILKEANKLALDRGFTAFNPDEVAVKGEDTKPEQKLTPTEANKVLSDVGAKPLTESEIAEAKRGPLEVIGEVFNSFIEAISLDKGEQKQYFQSKLDLYTKQANDPKASALDKLRAAELIKKYTELIAKTGK